MFTRRSFVATGLAGLAFAGCRPTSGTATGSRHKPTTAAGQRYFASLPGLHATHHEGLQAELARLEEEKQTPLLFDAALPTAQSRQSNDKPLVALEQAFPLLSRHLVMQQIAEVLPAGPFPMSPPQQERAKELLQRYKHGRKAFEQALPAEKSGYGLQTAQGYLARHDFLDVLEIGCRLCILSAADHQRVGDASAALAELQTAADAIKLLANEPSLVARSVATRLRGEWCLAACFQLDSLILPSHLREALLQSIRTQQSQLKPTPFYFAAERAAGLIAYEWVRHGAFLSLLSAEEVQSLTQQGLLPATRKAAEQNVDQDQHFYLSQMRELVDSCRLPHFQRLKALQKSQALLTQQQREGTYPQIASRLLRDLTAASRWMAMDETRLSSLEIALATSLAAAPRSAPISPLTGGKLLVETTPLHVTVRYSLEPTPTDALRSAAEEVVSCPIAQSLAMPETGPTRRR